MLIYVLGGLKCHLDRTTATTESQEEGGRRRNLRALAEEDEVLAKITFNFNQTDRRGWGS